MLPPIPSRLLGRPLRTPFLSLASRTTADVLDDLRASPELRAVLTAQWGVVLHLDPLARGTPRLPHRRLDALTQAAASAALYVNFVVLAAWSR